MEEMHAQVERELHAIMDCVVELTGLPSRWSEIVELVPNADFKGKKPFRCDILLDAALVEVPERWTTLIHEALHTVSIGYLRDDYQDFQGWEEGVVEQVQRLFCDQILTRLQVSVPHETLQALRTGHAYNNFIEALESLRLLLGESDAEAYYLRLLATPLRERPALLLGMANLLQDVTRRQFITAFAKANSVLRTRRPQGNLTP